MQWKDTYFYQACTHALFKGERRLLLTKMKTIFKNNQAFNNAVVKSYKTVKCSVNIMK
jgi:hypothetical protein